MSNGQAELKVKKLVTLVHQNDRMAGKSDCAFKTDILAQQKHLPFEVHLIRILDRNLLSFCFSHPAQVSGSLLLHYSLSCLYIIRTFVTAVEDTP